MELIKPRELKEGDTIGIISPSAGAATIYPHRLDNAIKFLKKEGYNVKEFSKTRKNNDWESAPAKERAKDIMDAFLDKEVKAIICTIGGEVANQTLEYLDFEKIKQNPKIFCGYSDISVLHYAFNVKSNLVTFYGPCIMTQFGEFPRPIEYTLEYFKKAVCSINPIGEIKASEEWTDELLDWGKKLDLTRPRNMNKNKGWTWLKEGKVSGESIGGCISSIMHLRGTEYWPNYKNKIFFWEIPEGQKFDEGEPLSTVDSYLEDLRLSGVFNEISGMIVGRPFKYSSENYEKLKKKILERTENYNFPILFGIDIGHTDPQITIPLGVNVIINSNENKFEIIESGINE
ncbi:LD-carboxypeptidase [archaeon]|nr:LD-carboxypeptidase [archaeon]|tara:strand:+ start:1378 stop:2412 length:1035 start_codon:yes stop_codon:yes gene_type:complete